MPFLPWRSPLPVVALLAPLAAAEFHWNRTAHPRLFLDQSRVALLPWKGMLRPAQVQGLDKPKGPNKLVTILLASKKSAWRNALAFSWAPVSDKPSPVSLETSNDGWMFRSQGRAVLVKWDGTSPQ